MVGRRRGLGGVPLALACSLAIEAAAAPVAFDHAAHLAALGDDARCDRCHPGDGAADRVRAGGETPAQAHPTCSDGACHAGAFGPRAEPPPMCGICHANADGAADGPPRWTRMAEMAPFPPADRAAGDLCVNFSHALHGDRGRMAPQAPLDDCAGCHSMRARAGGPGDDGRPRHADCAGCHDGQSAGPDGPIAPDMGDCAGCHARDDAGNGCRPALAHTRRILRGFSHATHAEARHPKLSRATRCDDCHRGAASTERVADIELLGRSKATMNGACRQCHDGRAAFHIDAKCSKCHPPGFLDRRGSAPTFIHFRR